ncbi:hypothetical protein L1987_86625 [Smallanthus sonchifolius]|uniref:Uncharacterized protein n=1 Tax=Smallanthus sonchifolius TaxID=185202 RepID=A0ACB8XZV7_9ASTR|nr:hypothetical protein L1987_86625 [Smallanthus sonchifolius]
MSYQERGILVSMLIFFLIFRFCTSIDTITLTQPLKDGDILVSNGETFALGFFSPGNSSNRYVGIWYNKVSDQTIVWVANRDRPIANSSGILSVDETGNLVLHEKDQGFVFWLTNVSGVANDVFSAQLLDSGNLVLLQGQNGEVYSWQSFDHPSNTFLPAMKLGLDRKTGLNRVFTSWKSSGNPGVGDYSYKMEFVGSTQMFLFEDRKWIGFWSAPKDQCDGYNHCGPFGLCDPYTSGTSFECACLPGYEPQSPQDWYLRDGSKGCKREVGTHIYGVGDGFVELDHVKVPDTSTARVNTSLGLEACEELCLRNCKC